MARLRSGRCPSAPQAEAQPQAAEGTPAPPSPRTPVRRVSSAHGPAKVKRQLQPNTPSRPGRLSAAMRDHQQGMKIRTACYIYNVKRSTLSDACRRNRIRNPGRPTELTVVEEQAIEDHLLVQADWGFPLTRMEVAMLVKGYLDEKGEEASRFKNNTPGRKWMCAFMKRHPNLNSKVPKLIKAARAKVSPDTLNRYFDNLERTLQNVPPENILNYDETNLTDNPACKHVIVRRSDKYSEKVMTTSKTATSLMFAGTAAGTLLPPYVVYKAKELSENWTIGGPRGARYNRTKSGWFDMKIFEEWFCTVLLPWAESLEGEKVVIGDNVSSHFSKKVFEQCARHNIKFVCLPPNSTHLLQPLDVAFFSPLKSAWRNLLSEWKQKSKNMAITLPKTAFPALLKDLLDAIEARREANLKAAFRATGIVPLDKRQALKRIPGGVVSPSRQEVYSRVSGTLVSRLEENRYGEKGAAPRGRRLQVSPGKSWAPTDLGLLDEQAVDEPDAVQSTTDPGPSQAKPAKKRKKKSAPVASDTQTEPTTEPGPSQAKPAKKRKKKSAPVASDTQTEPTTEPGPSQAKPAKKRKKKSAPVATDTQTEAARQEGVDDEVPPIEPQQGDYVLVKVGGGKQTVKHAVGLVDHFDEHLELAVKLMQRQEKVIFMWPTNIEIKSFDYSDVVEILGEPKKIKRKGVPLRFSYDFSKLNMV